MNNKEVQNRIKKSNIKCLLVANQFCCLFKASKSSRPSTPKMMLNYLADVVKDLTRTMDVPTVESCDGSSGKVWKMNAQIQWETVDRTATD